MHHLNCQTFMMKMLLLQLRCYDN